MRSIWLFALLFSAVSVADEPEQLVIELSVLHVESEYRVSGAVITTGGPVQWSYGTHNAHPYIDCTSSGKTRKTKLTSTTLFEGIDVSARVEDGNLLLEAALHEVSGADHDTAIEISCNTSKPVAVITRNSSKVPFRGGQSDSIKLGEDLILEFRLAEISVIRMTPR